MRGELWVEGDPGGRGGAIFRVGSAGVSRALQGAWGVAPGIRGLLQGVGVLVPVPGVEGLLPGVRGLLPAPGVGGLSPCLEDSYRHVVSGDSLLVLEDSYRVWVDAGKVLDQLGLEE